MAEIDQPDARRCRIKTAENGITGQAGTRLANNNRIQSCALVSAGTSWGGARNRADRVTYFLTLAQCEAMTAAADFALSIGLPFNRHWTVHYEKAGIAEAGATRFIRKLNKIVGEYCRRHGGRYAAIWAREGGEQKGGHVHILMHVPARLSLIGRTRVWVRLAGGTCKQGVSNIRAVAGRLVAAESGSEHYAANAAIVRDYLLKGAHPDARQALGLTREAEGGAIIGKRCGWTQNIGRSAQSATRELTCAKVWAEISGRI